MLDHCPGLLLHGGVFFVAQIASSRMDSIVLKVSQDGGQHFVKCMFPHEPNLKEKVNAPRAPRHLIMDKKSTHAFGTRTYTHHTHART